jgi:ATP-binding cassette, subfamily C, bacterial exporter for protease/lipase
MSSKPGSPQSEILLALKQFKGAFRAIGAFTAIINICTLASTIYMLQIYDRVLPSRNEMTLWMLTAMVLGFYALSSVLEWVRSQTIIRIGGQMDMQLNTRIYTAAFEQNLRRSGVNAGQALNDLTTVRQFVTGNGLFAFFDAPWFPIYLGIIFLFNIWLGIFATSCVVILVILAWINERVSKKSLGEANQLAVVSSNLASNNLRNAEVIEAMGMLPNLRQRWFTLHNKFLQLQAEASDKASAIGSVTKFFRHAFQSLILGFSAWLVLDNQISSGMMIAGGVLLGKALGPIEQIIGVWKQFSGVRTSYNRLNDLLSANVPRQPGLQLPKPEGYLTLEGVSAAPPGVQVAVLKGVSFGVVPGDVLGVIGPSASGKSTLARLMVGVWPAAVGKVRLDGADIFQWNKDELGPNMGYLPQDIELFSGSVSENIARFGQVDPEKVVEAAKLAGVHELILRLPKGYDTPLGVDGAGLSGGQKQRIGLARALYGNPNLIVLDEPNSNLDDAGEKALVIAIQKLRQAGKTVILITHRTSVISVTNKLLLLTDGAVKAFGPTQQVLTAIAQANQQAQQAAAQQQAAAAQQLPQTQQ